MITRQVNWVGRQVADGRYRILERLDKGSMGHVYRAYDRRLETDVVLKFPVAADAALEGPDFLERFSREIRSLVRLSHPHIVRIIDVGAEENSPYVVMQYLTGGSLKHRMETGPSGEAQAMVPWSLRSWLTNVAGALDFIHAQNYVHRDVKPANIMFDQHGHAFLGDFGLIKGLASETHSRNDSSLTGIGLLVGTPNYIAPELVMGHPADGRADQYSLAMTVHEVLTGSIFLEGPTPSATMVNQTRIQAPALVDLVDDVPQSLSDAVSQALSKTPAERFESCMAFAHQALADIPNLSSRSGMQSLIGQVSRGRLRHAPCPACRSILPVEPIHANKRARCSQCRAISLVQVHADGTVVLTIVHTPSATMKTARPDLSGASQITTPRPAPERPASGLSTMSRATPTSMSRETPPGGSRSGPPDSSVGMSEVPPKPRGFPRRVVLEGLAAAALPLLLIFGGMHLYGGRETAPVDGPAVPSKPATTAPPVAAPIEINLTFGTEKKKWLEAALQDFEKTRASRRIKVNLYGAGSIEGGLAVLGGPDEARTILKASKPVPVHVWSPASRGYQDVFEHEWGLKNNGASGIARGENLVLTPMVFVMWKHRYDPFIKKYGAVTFQTLGEAMREPGGWGAIANKPEWGHFKFSHTDPNKSNSGMLSLVMMAYAFTGKDSELALSDITQARFQRDLLAFERGLTRHGGTLVHSTGTLMDDMVLRGPSQYDCLLLYENLAIDNLRKAQARQGNELGELRVIYPDPNMWNEHPYYILNVPWSSPEHKAAATEFLDFLLSKRIQSTALNYGFRPSNADIPLDAPESPFDRNARFGVQIGVPRVCEPPKAEVVNDLLSTARQAEK